MFELDSEVLSSNNGSKTERICKGIKQFYLFSELECRNIEARVDGVIRIANVGGYKKFTVNDVSLRKKYFFGEGYTYGSQLQQKGPGMEKVYPKDFIDPIPQWIYDCVIRRLEECKLIPRDFVNSVVINDYQPGGCIVSHIDPPHIFDRPIISLSLHSDGALCFGCKFDFKPIRCTEPIFKVPLRRGVITLMSGYAANNITHCVRPEDTKFRRSVIILRRVLPSAPRLSLREAFTLMEKENTAQMKALTTNYLILQKYINSQHEDDVKRRDKLDKVKTTNFKSYQKGFRINKRVLLGCNNL